MTTPTVPALQAHVHELARASVNVRLIESPQLKPDEALALPHLRVVLAAPVIDVTTYAVTLHELGHLAAPLGAVRAVVGAHGNLNLRRDEEDAAWAWARHYALVWTPLMETLATWAEGTYAPPPPRPAPAPPTAVPSKRTINWNDWK